MYGIPSDELPQQQREAIETDLQSAGWLSPEKTTAMLNALKMLYMMARTTGGTAGKDINLRAACADAEKFFKLTEVSEEKEKLSLPLNVKKIAIEPTEAMRKAGAERLLTFEDDLSENAHSGLQWAGARNDAERVWRSMWLAEIELP